MAKHNHADPCAHVGVSFCKRCQVPFCGDCGKEWAEPCSQIHYTWTVWNGYPMTTAGGSNGSTTVVNAAEYPVLAQVWANHEDCVYDAVGV